MDTKTQDAGGLRKELAESCELLQRVAAPLGRLAGEEDAPRAEIAAALRAECPDAPFRALWRGEEGDGVLFGVVSGRLPEGDARLVKFPGMVPVDPARAAAAGEGLRLPADGDDPWREGDVICPVETPCVESDAFSLVVHWLGEEPLYVGRAYRFVPLAGPATSGIVGKIKLKRPLAAEEGKFVRHVSRGECAIIEVELDEAVVHDDRERMGPLSFGAMAEDGANGNFGVYLVRFALRRADNVRWQDFQVGRGDRAALLGQKPVVVWFTGLSGSGKSTAAAMLEKKLHAMGCLTYVLDGDNVRHGLCKDLGFTEEDRVENLRRVAEVARLMVDAGLIVLVSFISPFQHERDRARSLFAADEFLEVFVDTPLEECERRDVKGLYAKARAGLIRNFTGIDSPYEPPAAPDLHLRGDRMTPEEMADAIIRDLLRRGVLRT
ncbi:MAG TPA: adenylyl-sulfate kinase [Thermopetrobacter sp.]|nr:adenylyl-sulfate kinase [Thermopetrobacter sp.]